MVPRLTRILPSTYVKSLEAPLPFCWEFKCSERQFYVETCFKNYRFAQILKYFAQLCDCMIVAFMNFASELHWIYSTVLNFTENTALHWTALHWTALHCTELHWIALHCTAVHYTKLHCTVPQWTAPYLNIIYKWNCIIMKLLLLGSSFHIAINYLLWLCCGCGCGCGCGVTLGFLAMGVTIGKHREI